MNRRLLPPLLALATAAGVLLALPDVADAQPNPCRPGFVLAGVLCAPDPNAAPQVAPAPSPPPAQPAPAPHRSLLDRVLGRNRPTPAPAPSPAPPPPSAAPAPAPVRNPAPPAQAEQPPVVPVIVLPAPGTPIPLPSERTVWLHTCVDLYAANTHLLQINNQALDVPPLAYVIFQCAANPGMVPLIPITPTTPVPGQPPSAVNQTVFSHLPVTG